MTTLATFSAALEAKAKSRAARRAAAFEANLAARLAEEIGPAAGDPGRAALISALGAAYRRERHLIDARTVFGFRRLRFYMVLQAGLRRGAAARSEAGAPFAAAVLNRAQADGLAVSAPAPILRAISGAEISQRHPVDHRIILRNRWFALYLLVVGGRDRRMAAATPVTTERRGAARRGLGGALFLALIFILAGVGLFFIGATLYGFGALLAEPEGREALLRMIEGTFQVRAR